MIDYYHGFCGKLGLWHWTMMFMATVCSPVCQFLHQHPLKPLSYFNQMSQEVILPKIVPFSKTVCALGKCCPGREERVHQKMKEKAGDVSVPSEMLEPPWGWWLQQSHPIHWLWHWSDPWKNEVPSTWEQLDQSRAVPAPRKEHGECLDTWMFLRAELWGKEKGTVDTRAGRDLEKARTN